MAPQALHYRYHPLPQDIICAETAIATLPATVDALGARRAMITCGPTILRACNVVPRVQEALGSRSVGVYAGVVYPNPADNSISAEIGKTAMNSAASSFKMPQGNALTRFHRFRCSSAHKAPTPVHPPMLHPLGLLFDRTLVGANWLHVVS